MSVTVSADDIKRVKGLGFLQQKGTDTFNARVLTRNGKITTKEAMMVAEAADKYGNGEMAFTTRQTIEVQGIHYDNIPAFTAAIEAGGLLVGGTGPKVRPIVSCKGTTCQYGLYDTYGLSEKIHERFYI
ncbi:MAG: (4Fe-4S)-binding protein, partial [Anaerotignum sp.]|nr:(4Fe-4S)-binding protein [Anaerotignum sp.]